ncbi:MAG: ester cyclase [Halobacteria archaeon]|nr:ester cyclase [Halobacteria archaeon]
MPTKQKKAKALVRQALEETFDEANVEILGEVCTTDYVHHTALGEDVEGREAFIAFAEGLHDAFDDLTFDIETIIAEDDTVAVRGVVSGVHVGEFQGISPTEESVTWKSYVFARIEDGKMAESWVLSDAMGLVQQLGATPELA